MAKSKLGADILVSKTTRSVPVASGARTEQVVMSRALEDPALDSVHSPWMLECPWAERYAMLNIAVAHK